MNMATPVFLHGYSGGGESLREFATACFPGQLPVCVDLPGFGGSKIVNRAAEADSRAYIEEVWQAVRRAVPEGKIHLVGHSYGAALAFALAAEYPNVVTRIDLFMPGILPRLMSRIGLVVAKAFDYVPGGLQPFTWVLQRPLLVDGVTRSMEHKSWPEVRRRQIRAMRRKESLTYSPQMFRLSFHILQMAEELQSVRCTVPVRIVYATDDTVAGYASCKWFEGRSEHIEVTATHGGHLGVVAEPERMASILYG